MTFVVLSAVLALKAWNGVFLLWQGWQPGYPSAMFMLFACRHQAKQQLRSRVAWSFAIGEGLKVILTIALLIVALGLFKAAFVPLGLTYLSVLIVQILAPAVINGHRT